MINDPLQIRHDANQPIEWYTDGLVHTRMLLNETLTNETVGSFTNLDLSGFLGVGRFINAYDKPAARFMRSGVLPWPMDTGP